MLGLLTQRRARSRQAIRNWETQRRVSRIKFGNDAQILVFIASGGSDQNRKLIQLVTFSAVEEMQFIELNRAHSVSVQFQALPLSVTVCCHLKSRLYCQFDALSY
jgi:hypothetical protein